MAITPGDLGGDEDLAREVLLIAHDIAPCIESFVTGTEDFKNALAILKRVMKNIVGRGSPYVKSKRQGSASIEYTDVQSAFEGHATRALRALCGSGTVAGLPAGSFPAERPVSRLWPETYTS
ncbi:hypothetical protein SCB71_06325 [Herbiconiux sp. KACC 21604]|uniref:hypothetical protein n=1 Tax=unclassified Herbiconiux TaxID=2618217 RepID=UPI0014922C94|nr:hypothetical protein [Herbiconiux sp. SALV-R1]QJU52934.1 hypothetical protein HL652_04310 [Herbiconiux sp. SALV-R1]WPO87854.1 hypothetical protein SCB71_06325 [Herbiconiux sp. KACC 21604]